MADAPLAGPQGRRTRPHPGRALGRPDAGRSRRRRDQGRKPRGRRHAPLGAALRRRRRRDARPPISTPATAASARSWPISRRPRGGDAVRALAAEADVLIENFKVGGLAKYGLDYASLHGAEPAADLLLDHRLRPDGPLRLARRLRFHDPGHGRHHGPDRRAGRASRRRSASPSRISSPALYAVVGIQAALLQRERTGQGQHIDMALFDCMTGVLANQALNYLASGSAADAHGQRPSQYRALPDLPGGGRARHRRGRQRRAVRPASAPCSASTSRTEPDFATNALRVANREALRRAHHGGATRDLVPRPAARRAGRAGVPAGPINTVADVFADPQFQHRGMRIENDGIPGVRTPILDVRGRTWQRAPVAAARRAHGRSSGRTAPGLGRLVRGLIGAFGRSPGNRTTGVIEVFVSGRSEL